MSLAVERVIDPAAAARALRAVAGEAREPDQLTRILPRDDGHLLAAFDGGEAVGYAYGYELPRLKRPGTSLLLYGIEVVPERRRQGIGRALLDAFATLTAERGCDSHWLLTNASNEPAMRLYAAAGAERPQPDDVLFSFPSR